MKATLVLAAPLAALPAALLGLSCSAEPGPRGAVPEAPPELARRVRVARSEADHVEGLLWFEGGTAREPAGRAGLVEVLAEALQYGGPTSLSGAEFHGRLAQRGASLRVLASEDALEIEFHAVPGDLAAVLDAAAQLVRHPHYPPEVVELARERLLDRLEREADDPAALADARSAAAAYGPEAPYARRPTCASAEAIERADLLAWHRANLGRDRLWAAAVGPLETDDLARELERAFAELGDVGPAPALARAPLSLPEPPQLTALVVPGCTRIELRLLAPGVDIADADYAPLRIWSDVTGRRPASGAFFAARWAQRGELFAFVSTADTRSVGAARELADLLEHLGGAALEPLLADDFERARARVLAAHEALLASPRALLGPLRHGAPEDFWERHGAALRAATPSSVAAAAARHLPPAAWRALGVFPEPPAAADWPWPLAPVDGERPLRGSPAAVALLERALESLGGRAAWRALDGLELAGEVHFEGREEPVRVRVLRDLAGERLRIEQSQDGVASAQIATPTGAFSARDGTVTALDETVRALVLQRERTLLYRVLRELARATTHAVTLDGEGRLAVQRRGRPLCTLELGPDGRPARLLVPESALEPARESAYADWAPRGAAGLWFAAEVRDGDGGRSFRWSRIDPDWVPGPDDFSAE